MNSWRLDPFPCRAQVPKPLPAVPGGPRGACLASSLLLQVSGFGPKDHAPTAGLAGSKHLLGKEPQPLWSWGNLLLTDKETEAQGRGLWSRAGVRASTGLLSARPCSAQPGYVFIVSADLY